MAPQQHLDWFEENISWFEAIPTDRLATPVPNCPGWTIEDVLNHLSFGLGLGYPIALSKAPGTAAEDVFAELAFPDESPTGAAATATFSANLRRCLQTFAAADPNSPCWTYAGPGTAGFWMRRAAIESTLHRMDVAEALPETASPLAADRAIDAIAETVEFALPLAAGMTDRPTGRLSISSPELGLKLELGAGPRNATIVGSGDEVLGALWGRSRERVGVVGDEQIAADWLSVVERAFAGR